MENPFKPTLRESIAYRKKNFKATLYLFKRATLKKALHILRLNRRPIVIGGCGRSGTTLLLSVLSCHPKIFSVDQETRAFCPGGYLPDPLIRAPFKLKKLYDYFIDHEIPDTCSRWCEKTPRNVLYFGRILHHFGYTVRIIHLVRDGRDVVTSTHPSRSSRPWITPQRWINDVLAGQKLENHPQVLTVRYEDLVRDYETTIRRICTFIEAPFVEAFLSYPESARLKQNVAWFGKADTPNTKSIGRWKQPEYEERVRSLMSDPRAVSMLKYYGYYDRR